MKHAATREEQALAEIASTQISRGSALLLVFVFLATIVGVPLWQEFQLRGEDGQRPDVAALLPNAERALPSVSELRRFEDDLEDGSFLRELFLSPVQSLLCRVGAGNEQVYLGDEGWLYYRADVDHVTGPGFLDAEVLERRRREGDETSAPPEPDPLVGILDLRDQLAERGIELVVVPTPLKPSVHPEHLGGTTEGARFDNPSMGRFLERLDDACVGWLDPLELMRSGDGPHYLATDTHWTPQVMERVAQALARRVREIVPAPANGTSSRFTRKERTLANAGDVTRMLDLERPETLFDDEEVVIHEVTDTRPDDAAGRVLLLGDSFSNIYSLGGMGWGNDAGLAEQIAFALQEPVEALRINDNGSFATRQALRRELVQGNDLLANKRVVLYQFAARELSQGDWRAMELPAVEASARRDSVGDRVHQVTGIVRAVAPVPRPGSVPYKDAVTAIHLVEVQGEPALARNEALVFRWGMKDGAWTSTTELREGDELACELVPWERASSEYGGYNRSELADEALWELPTFWAPMDSDADPDADAEETASGTSPTLAALGESEVVEGNDGWLFFGPELRHLAAGEFWGEAARAVGQANDESLRDPLPAIVDFQEQLSAAGIELWVVPVPPKAAVYPEHTGASAESDIAQVDRRFLEVLRENDVRVLDLFALFETGKGEEDVPLYCKSDTHWSPRACELVAQELARLLEGKFDDVARQEFVQESHRLEVVGDLERRLARDEPRREELSLRRVREGNRAVQPWRESPLLLVGDSHTLVFHAGGDLLAKGSGLPEQLAAELGFAPDVVGVRGSGSTAARISLLRRRDNLAGKRVCVWVFAGRELSQSAEGWRKVPVIRN